MIDTAGPEGRGLDKAQQDAFHGKLLAWYRAHRRDLPWRRSTEDPYAIWVSEIMLQQTQVATVIPYYLRWMERFPTVQSLADAPLEEVLRHWAGLGYYARARNLHAAAKQVVDRFGGELPAAPALLAGLPGIGRYTRGAILSIGFNRPAPILDANVVRVLTRVFAVDGDPKSGAVQERLWQLAEEILPAADARDFNQALMELGALVCTPGDPACERCPLLSVCRAGNSPDPTAWPQIPAGRRTVRVVHASALLRRESLLLLVQRPPHGLWGGLWEFPRRVCAAGETPEECAVRAAREVAGLEAQMDSPVGPVKHGVTHHSITLYGFLSERWSGEPQACDCAAVHWVSASDLTRRPLAAPQRLLAELALRSIADDVRQPRLEL